MRRVPRQPCDDPPAGVQATPVADWTQAERDRYDRLLRYVQRRGKDVGRAQVLSVHAQVYVYRNDPFSRTSSYERAEKRAQSARRGSWARCWR